MIRQLLPGMLLGAWIIGAVAHADVYLDAQVALDQVMSGDLAGAGKTLDEIYASGDAEKLAAAAYMLLAGGPPGNGGSESESEMMSSVNYVIAVQRADRAAFVTEQAARLLDKAVESGNENAIMTYAFMYSGGGAIQNRDPKQYRYWLERGVAADIADARTQLAALDAEEQKLAQGDPETLFNSGKELVSTRDEEKALRGLEMIKQAADGYHVPAIHYIGDALLRNRKGDSPEDFALALKYFRMGVEVGDSLSRYTVEDIEVCLEDGSTCAEL